MNDKALGVFVCECGGKIAVGQISNLSNVEQANYWCLPANIERMRATIAERHSARVVIAGCAPRTHATLFRRALDGLVEPSLINVVNVRDLCALPHRDDLPGALAKARAQIAMAVADVTARSPHPPRRAPITSHAVVIGGGIAGTTAALAISDARISVTLVERAPELSGESERIAKIFARANIRVKTNTTVHQVSGAVGQYRVELSSGEHVQAGVIVVATGVPSNLQPPTSNSPKRCACPLIRMVSSPMRACDSDHRTESSGACTCVVRRIFHAMPSARSFRRTTLPRAPCGTSNAARSSTGCLRRQLTRRAAMAAAIVRGCVRLRQSKCKTDKVTR